MKKLFLRAIVNHPCKSIRNTYLSRCLFTAACFLMYFTNSVNAQGPTLEFAKITGDGNPTGNGPVYSTTINFVRNTDNPGGTAFALLNHNVNATFAFSNQQYLNHPNLPGGAMVIGYQTNTPNTIYTVMDATGAAVVPGGVGPATDYTSANSAAGTGIVLGSNNAIRVQVYTRPLYLYSRPPLGTYYLGDLTISFSEPVDNPILHMGGVGGNNGAGTNQQGFCTQFKVAASNVPVTLSKLSGTSFMAVTADSIYHSSADIVSGATLNYVSGSVRINGTRISSITFRCYMRGDGGRTVPDIVDWGGEASGDGFLLALSLPDIRIVAVNDNYGTVPAGSTTASVLANDTLYRTAITVPSDVTTSTSPMPAGITLNANGTVTIAPGTPSGPYTFNYQICAAEATPAVCSIATVTLNVTNPLPVTFGPVNAVIENGILHVNFSSETENNNSYFEIEVSQDGNSFTKIGEVVSKAGNGNSSGVLNYSFSKDLSGLALASGLGLLLLGGIAFGRNRRLVFAMTTIVGLALCIAACTKSVPDATAAGDGFVRIGQVDKDGTKQYSKVVKITHNN